jgi:hypothetical protein
MKSQIIEVNAKTPIDWSKKQMVTNVTKVILLTSGDFGENSFKGTVIFPGDSMYIVGYHTSFLKEHFRLVDTPITIKFEN